MTRFFSLFSVIFVFACACADQQADRALGTGNPIVLYWTVDTLGMQAAKETGWCERMRTILGAHDRDLACLDGAVAGSSWTAESHVRTLWPQHWSGERRDDETPPSGSPSVLETLANEEGASYVFASDNAIFELVGENGADPWISGADASYIAEDAGVTMDNSEDETPVHRGMTDILRRTADGESVVAYMNDYEAGGHEPRCFFDPNTPECKTLWQLAVDSGLADADDDPAAAWVEHGFQAQVAEAAIDLFRDNPAELRELFWGTMLQSIEHFHAERFDVRLERLLNTLEAQGRIDDLVVVVAGDHGENPCVTEPFTNEINCSHTGAPTEWTARVPVFVSPARIANEWQEAGIAGDAITPWSLGNIAWGLLDSHGAAIPDNWPEMQPVGTATSWDCPQGLRVVDNVSLRCNGMDCAAYEWTTPDDVSFEPIRLETIPPELADFAAPQGGDPNWFMDACTIE